MDYNSLLKQISEQYQNMLGKNMVGIYVHGSIAFGCFNWERSDIDFLVVINEPITKQTKIKLLKVLTDLSEHAPPKGFEMSVVLRKYCADFIYPTPYELHFSNDYLDECDDELKVDPDLAAHFMVITKVGIVLYGEEISTVFGVVPEADYLDSIIKDVENAKEDIVNYPVYIILNLCRVLAFIKEGLVLSKMQGGQWAMVNFPEKYLSLIKSALENYINGTEFIGDDDLQIEFASLVDAIKRGGIICLE